METRNLKIGDKVWGGIGRNASYAVIDEIKDETRSYVDYKGVKVVKTTTNAKLSFPNDPTDCFYANIDNLYKADDLVIDINMKSKWEVNRLLGDAKHKVALNNGYFGAYSLIDYKGKQAIVYVDDRNARVNMMTAFYDAIFYGREYGCSNCWDGDHRWNHDYPIVVFDKEKGYNMVSPHSNKLLCDEWLSNLNWEWHNSATLNDYLNGTTKNGTDVLVTRMGSIRFADNCDSSVIAKELANVKSYDKESIINNWILADKPCAFIHGLEYKGAKWGIISKEDALGLFISHCDFGKPFNSAEWRILDGQITLLMREYANSDYD